MKNIKGFEDYLITEDGNVYSKKYGKIRLLKQQYHRKGYKVVTLSKKNIKKTVKIHRLVAEAYLQNNLNKEQVNHIDGNKENNHVNNLEWVTQSENQLHAHKSGLMNSKIQKTKEIFSKQVVDMETGIFYNSLKDACQLMNIKYKSEFARMKYYNRSRFKQI